MDFPAPTSLSLFRPSSINSPTASPYFGFQIHNNMIKKGTATESIPKEPFASSIILHPQGKYGAQQTNLSGIYIPLRVHPQTEALEARHTMH